MSKISRVVTRNATLIIVTAINGAAFLFALYFFLSNSVGKPSPTGVWALAALFDQPKPSGIEYKDYISILLTAIGVLMAALAAILAVAAVWGFSAIQKAAQETARRTAVRVAKVSAEAVARDVADVVATRVARAAEPSETSEAEAEKIAMAMRGDNGKD